MTGADIYAARRALGDMWGLDRPLHYSELGRALRMQGRDPGATIRDWERRDGPTGPVSVAISMMLAGAMPPDPLESIIAQRGRPAA